MRAGAGFNATVMAVPAAVAGAGGGHSGWHSPVPYLFGGLAAMLGLIAFALLLLACSYWKLSGYLEGNGRDGGNASSGVEQDAKMGAAAMAMLATCYEEKIVVIMAGDEKPTYLATPMSSRASSFGEHSSKGGDKDDKEEEEGKKNVEDCMGTGNENQNKDHNQGQSENESVDV